MDERRDLVDREELRRRLERERDCCNPDGSHAFTLRWVIEILDAMPAAECPRGWTRDEVLAELDADPDAVCEWLSPDVNKWYPVNGHRIGQWHPEVRRYDVRVVRVAPEPEWVPLTDVPGRRLEGRPDAIVHEVRASRCGESLRLDFLAPSGGLLDAQYVDPSNAVVAVRPKAKA